MYMNNELKDILFLDIETVANVYDYNALDERLKVQWSRKANFFKRDTQQTDEEQDERLQITAYSSGDRKLIPALFDLFQAGLLSKSAASTKLFKKYPDWFELTPEKQPNKVQYRVR